jgi:hypothetical protein
MALACMRLRRGKLRSTGQRRDYTALVLKEADCPIPPKADASAAWGLRVLQVFVGESGTRGNWRNTDGGTRQPMESPSLPSLPSNTSSSSS